MPPSEFTPEMIEQIHAMFRAGPAVYSLARPSSARTLRRAIYMERTRLRESWPEAGPQTQHLCELSQKADRLVFRIIDNKLHVERATPSLLARDLAGATGGPING